MIPPEPEWSWYLKLLWIVLASAVLAPLLYYIATDGLDVITELFKLQFDFPNTPMQSTNVLCTNPHLIAES